MRQLLRPGQQAIDIGAKYGLFTVSMAKAVCPSGRVWAFEPASATVAYLTKTIAENQFSNVVLDRRGVSSGIRRW